MYRVVCRQTNVYPLFSLVIVYLLIILCRLIMPLWCLPVSFMCIPDYIISILLLHCVFQLLLLLCHKNVSILLIMSSFMLLPYYIMCSYIMCIFGYAVKFSGSPWHAYTRCKRVIVKVLALLKAHIVIVLTCFAHLYWLDIVHIYHICCQIYILLSSSSSIIVFIEALLHLLII